MKGCRFRMGQRTGAEGVEGIHVVLSLGFSSRFRD